MPSLADIRDIPYALPVFIALVVAILLVIILLIFVVSGDKDLPDTSETLQLPSLDVIQKILGPLRQHHFLLPNPEQQVLQLQLVPFREPRSPWASDEIRPFWRDPLEMGLEGIVEENRRLVDQLYKMVP